MNRLKSLLIIIFLLFTSNAFAGYDKLTKGNYDEYKNEKGIVLYGVNWGREWGCAGFDNAQLDNLIFSRIDPASGNLSEDDIVIENSAKLLARRNVSESYAIIVEPGEYALTDFDIKVAISQSETSHIKVTSKDLFKNGSPAGGSFEMNAGEIVYIGDFGLDCTGDHPILWRYYIPRDDFDSYVAGFKERYEFVGARQVIYRLFQTDEFGQ